MRNKDGKIDEFYSEDTEIKLTVWAAEVDAVDVMESLYLWFHSNSCGLSGFLISGKSDNFEFSLDKHGKIAKKRKVD